MNLSDQICSLDLAKRLKELGVKQSSLFYHLIGGICARSECLPLMGDDWYSAFTCSELGEMLPWFIEKENKTYWYATGKTRKNDKYYQEHEINYSDSETTACLSRCITEADARAKMLIYLIENNLTELPK